MKKMPCLFVREFHSDGTFTITEQVTPGCEWVLAGEGVATRKWDGTAVLVKEGRMYARYDAKPGRTPPPGAIPCEPEPDPETGHWPHWVVADRPQDNWIRQAAENSGLLMQVDGTYEACGPKIATRSGPNPERLEAHALFRHGSEVVDVPRSFEGIRSTLSVLPWEGLVFHHPDGRMAKIRCKDFGLPWPVEGEP